MEYWTKSIQLALRPTFVAIGQTEKPWKISILTADRDGVGVDDGLRGDGVEDPAADVAHVQGDGADSHALGRHWWISQFILLFRSTRAKQTYVFGVGDLKGQNIDLLIANIGMKIYQDEKNETVNFEAHIN